MIGILWGASIAGLIGIVIAVPLIASVHIILQYIYGRLTGKDAFMPEPEKPQRQSRILMSLRALRETFSSRTKLINS